MGMIPVFWIDALMLAYGGMLMRNDAKQKDKQSPNPAETGASQSSKGSPT